MELDPDLQLYARLSLGRGAQRVLILSVFTVVIVAASAGVFSTATLTAAPVRASYALALPLALALLVFGPSRAIARLFEFEREGLLDHMRLCGRPPARMLAACLLGSTTPYVILSGALLFAHQGVKPDLWLWMFAMLVLCAATALSLLAYGVVPSSAAPDPQFMTPLLLLVGAATAVAVRVPAWVTGRTFAGVAPLTTIVVVLVALPCAIGLACRRIRRPPLGALRLNNPLRTLTRRLMPANGPPEFLRQLRIAARSSGTVAAIGVAPLLVLGVSAVKFPSAPLKDIALNAIPYFVLLAGYAAISLTVRRETASGAIEFVRLTPQRGASVALGWFFGLGIPLWATAALALLTLTAVRTQAIEWSWWLPALAIVIPVIALAEGLSRRRPGVYLCLPLVLYALAHSYARAQDESIVWAAEIGLWEENRPLYRDAERIRAELPKDGSKWRTPEFREKTEQWSTAILKARAVARSRQQARIAGMPGAELRTGLPRYLRIGMRPEVPAWPFNVPFSLTAIAAALALGAAAGRVRRADGPSFAAWPAIAAAAIVVVAVRAFPVIAFPRLLPAILIALAPFVSMERAIPTAPWRRVALAAVAAAIAGTVVARQGGIDWAWSLETGIAACLTLGLGILVHELTWRTPLVSLGLRSLVLLLLIRSAQSPVFGSRSAGAALLMAIPDMLSEQRTVVPLVPPATTAMEMLLLATLLLVAAAVHTRRRRLTTG